MILKKTFLYLFPAFFLTASTANSIEIGSEISFEMLAGYVINDKLEPRGYPFDCRIGFEYSTMFSRYHWKVDGAMLCSMTELMNHEIIDTVGVLNNEAMGNYIPIYGKRKYRSILVSGNIVPCFTIRNIYAGLGVSVQYLDVLFDDTIGDTEPFFNVSPFISLGYSWKLVQLGVYMDDFIQRMGIQMKVNLLTIRKSINSAR